MTATHDAVEHIRRVPRTEGEPSMTEVALRPSTTTTDLSIEPDQQFWNEKQKAALVQLGIEEASNADLAIFFHQVKRTGLDPFVKQIYMIGRKSKEKVWDNGQQVDRWVTKQTIQTGIDGYRLVARRAADREGVKLRQSEPLWCGEDMQWLEVWPFDVPPVAAKVVVYRDGEPYPGVAMYREFVQTNRDGSPNSMWKRMPANQLAKCAEAQATRKAFPQDLAGIYVDAEMGPADRTEDGAHVVTSVPARRVTASEITGGGAEGASGTAPPPAGPKANQGQLKRIHGLLKDMDITSDAGIRDAIGVALGLGGPIKSRRDLLRDQADVVIAHLEKVGPPAPGDDEVPPPDEPPSDGES